MDPKSNGERPMEGMPVLEQPPSELTPAMLEELARKKNREKDRALAPEIPEKPDPVKEELLKLRRE